MNVHMLLFAPGARSRAGTLLAAFRDASLLAFLLTCLDEVARNLGEPPLRETGVDAESECRSSAKIRLTLETLAIFEAATP